MKILGIDPGTRFLGFGILAKGERGEIELVDYGIIHALKVKDYSHRLFFIFQEIERLISQFQPQALVLEEVFFGKNFKNALKIGESRGVVMACSGKHGVPIFEYSTREVKKSLTGSGRASKIQVRNMVGHIFGLRDENLRDDITDAIALAFCHTHRILFQNLEGFC